MKNAGSEKLRKNFRLNADAGIVSAVREGLKLKGGYCPCKLEISADTRCICKEFRDLLEDDNWSGYCHCLLYYKPPKEAEEGHKKGK